MKKLVYTLVVVLLAGGAVLLFISNMQLRQDLLGAQAMLDAKKMDTKTMQFLQMFIKQVIKSKGEINFDTRLKLENAVRELNDPAILDQWKKFTASQDETEAQANVKDLLDMLVDRVMLAGNR